MRWTVPLLLCCVACAGSNLELRRAAARDLDCPLDNVRVEEVKGDEAIAVACFRRARLVRDDGAWTVVESHPDTDVHDLRGKDSREEE